MSFIDWQDKIKDFKKVDVRGIQGNFFPGLKQQAAKLPVGAGLEVVQNFDPIPLYEVMQELGFEYHTEQTGRNRPVMLNFMRTSIRRRLAVIPVTFPCARPH